MGLKEARKELARGDADAALALLWNALEPARLAGDRRALRTIEGLAGQIARSGGDAHRREAERLVEAVHELAQDPDAPVGVARMDADVATGGAVPPGEEVEGGEQQRSGAHRIASLVWLLVIIGVVIANVLGGNR